MSKEKLSLQEIADQLAIRASISKRAAEDFLKIMFGTIEETLLAGHQVKIKNFGTFKLQWNEPRKSVNVNTGEEIVIDGYYKVNFVPEAALKEQINEPYAHLEPLALDDDRDVEPAPVNVINETDPLRTLEQQAAEIKGILKEIMGEEKKSKTEIPLVDDDSSFSDLILEEEDREDEEDGEDEQKAVEENLNSSEPKKLELNDLDDSINIINLIDEESKEEIYAEPIVSTDGGQAADDSADLEATLETTSNKTLSELDNDDIFPTPFMVDSPVKHRKWWIIPTILVVFGIAASLLYYFYLPATNWVDSKYANLSAYFDAMKKNASVSQMITSAEKKIATSKKPTSRVVSDSSSRDSIIVVQSVDSVKLLLDGPRIYKKFLTTEQIKDGNRLTLMSLKYYGSKDFWVYIYEANKDHIKNPDRIETGTIIKIPELDKRLINLKDPRCVQKARELHDLYVGK